MSDYDFVDSGEAFAWVDTPGNDFVDADIHIVRLQHLRVADVSQHLRARLIIGDMIMQGDLEIFLGAGNVTDLQLIADDADTGETNPLTASQMATITGCKLALDSTIIDSAEAGLGADQPFDNVTKADKGVLSIDMGSQTLAAKAYRLCLLSIKFSNSAKPKIINLRRKTIVYPPL